MPDVGTWDVLLRLVVAAALGGAIGLERELREREAGLRTHLLVSVGSAVFTLVSAYGFADFDYGARGGITLDPTRIAAQIVTGIGFLGAGAIIRQGVSIRGLTTAATLWVAAAIGMAAGAGYYAGAVLGTIVTLIALWPLRRLAFPVFDRLRPEERSMIIDLRPGTKAARLLAALEQEHARVEYFQLVDDEDDRRTVTVTLDTPSQELLSSIADLEFVEGVQWRR